MKNYTWLVILFIFCFIVFCQADVLAWFPPPNHPPCRPGGPVGAPLDGGLLAILGAAGVAYFAARKKKQN